MHYRGKDARFEIQRPGERAETLLFVPRYDFNWQLKYQLQDPGLRPKGTRLIITFHYDNSPKNRSNPDPSRTIRWGEPSEEEMMSGWIDYIEASPKPAPAQQSIQRRRRPLSAAGISYFPKCVSRNLLIISSASFDSGSAGLFQNACGSASNTTNSASTPALQIRSV